MDIIEFIQLTEVDYQVIDDSNDRYFIGELDDALDVYNSWSLGEELDFELEWFVDLEEGMTFICDFDLDDNED